MRVALISDVHANLPALESVLAHIKNQDVHAIWNMGDLVGYGANPDQIVRRLREENVLNIAGRYDSRVLKLSKKRALWRENKRPEVFLAIQWADENLSEPSRDYLETLPEEITMRLGSTRILLTHGSPVSSKDKLSRGTPETYLQEILITADVQVIICGNSHEPFSRKVDSGYCINPGSVGYQTDGDIRASYALLDLDPELMVINSGPEVKLEVRHYRIDYDIEAAVSDIRQRGLPEAYAQMLLQGKDLKTVLTSPEKWQVPNLEDQSWWKSPFKDKTRQQYEDKKVKEVIKLAEKGSYNEEHVEQATFLALRLFDELQPLHRLSSDERFWLRCGSLLHDIGKGNKKHHIKALDMILSSKNLPFTAREKSIIGSIARYHRRGGPRERHSHLTGLPVVDQRVVTILSSILRVADGLDASPTGNVIDLSCSYSKDEITIECKVKDNAGKQKKRALGKGELMEFAFDRELFIEWHRI